MNLFDRLRFAASTFGVALRSSGLPTTVFEDYPGQSGKYNADPGGAYRKAYQRISWAFSAIHWKATFAAMAPLKIYAVPAGGTIEDKQEVPWNHPAYVVWRHVNSLDTNYTLQEKITGHRNISGYAFVLKVGPGMPYKGPPTELHVLRPDKVKEIKYDTEGNIDHYLVGYKRERIPAAQMIYIPSFDPYGGWGQSPLTAAEQALKAEVNSQHLNNALLENMGVPGTLFKSKTRMSKAQEEVFLRVWDKWHRGPKRAGKTAILPADIEVLVKSLPQSDMLMPELRKMNREEIFGVFGVNAAAMGLDVADRSRHVEARKGVAEDTMVPELTMMAQFFTQNWLNEYEGENLICDWDWSKVPALKEDGVVKTDTAVKLVVNRIISPNEARATYLGLKPYTGGDDILAPMMLIPVGSENPAVASKGEKSRSDGPVYTDWQRARLEAYARRVTQTEKQVARWLDEMFEKQHAAVMKAFKRAYPESHTTPRLDAGRFSRRDLDDIFEEALLEGYSVETIRRSLTLALSEGIAHGLDGMGDIGFDFSLEQSPELMKWLKINATKHASLINGTTLKQMAQAKETIIQMVSEGALTSDIEAKLDDVFRHRRLNVKTIARTEVQQGVQHGQMTTWKESGVVQEKVWLESFSGHERHAGMHEQTVGIDEDFVMPDGTTLQAPGMSGVPGQDINCMCDMAPKVNLKKAIEHDKRWLAGELWPVEAAGRGSKEWQNSEYLRRLTEAV